MWPSHIAKPLKRAPIKRSAEDGEDFPRRSGMDDLRGRHPMFRMPAWMSEDEDMSDLAARMSHTPHFATMGRRGGPWRERRSSGGSAMSATSDDSCDAPTTDKSSQCSGGSSDMSAHEIPIRIEAPCPPSMEQNAQTHPQQQQDSQHEQQQQQLEENEPISPLSSRVNNVRKGTQYPMRTTSAVDATQPHEEFTRNTRCSSAPPEMADQQLPHTVQKPQPQRFVSKINITPQSPLSPKAPSTPFSPLPAKFNTVPKPFVPVNKQQSETQQTPSSFEQQVPEQPPLQQNQYQNFQPQYQPQQPQPQQQPQSQQHFHPQQQPQPQHQQQQFQQQPQYQQQQSPRQGSQRPSVVRNIPIFVEGRDGPSSNEESHTPPKPAPQWSQPCQQQQPQSQPWQQQQPQPQPWQQQQSQPQPWQQQQHQPQAPPQQQKPQQKSQLRQQQTQQAPQSQPVPTPIPAPAPPQYQPQEQPPQSEPKAKPQPPKDPRLTQIEAVQALVDEYKTKVDTFCGTKKDREFLYLDEMLTRALLQLDNVDPDGREDVRQARRAVIKNINAAISALEARATGSLKTKKEKTPETSVAAMETDTQEQDGETANENEPAEALPSDSPEQNSESRGENIEKVEPQGVSTSANSETNPEAMAST